MNNKQGFYFAKGGKFCESQRFALWYQRSPHLGEVVEKKDPKKVRKSYSGQICHLHAY